MTASRACAHQAAVHNLCWSALQATAVHPVWQPCWVAEGLTEDAVNHNQPAGALDVVVAQGLLRRLLAENCCLLQGQVSMSAAEVQLTPAARRLLPVASCCSKSPLPQLALTPLSTVHMTSLTSLCAQSSRLQRSRLQPTSTHAHMHF